MGCGCAWPATAARLPFRRIQRFKTGSETGAHGQWEREHIKALRLDGNASRADHLPQRVFAICAGTADCQTDSAMVRWIGGRVVCMPGVLPGGTAARVSVCALDNARAKIKPAEFMAYHSAGPVAGVSANRSWRGVERSGIAASSVVDSTAADRHDWIAVRDAFGDQSAAAGLAGARRQQISLSIFWAFQFCIAHRAAFVSVLR